jgi:hypothetical protein
VGRALDLCAPFHLDADGAGLVGRRRLSEGGAWTSCDEDAQSHPDEGEYALHHGCPIALFIEPPRSIADSERLDEALGKNE